MHCTDRCPSRSTASTCLLRMSARARPAPVPLTFLCYPLPPVSETSSSTADPPEEGKRTQVCYFSLTGIYPPMFSTVRSHRRRPSPPPISFITPPPCVRSPLRLVCLEPCPCALRDPYALSWLYMEKPFGMRHLPTWVTRILTSFVHSCFKSAVLAALRLHLLHSLRIPIRPLRKPTKFHKIDREHIPIETESRSRPA